MAFRNDNIGLVLSGGGIRGVGHLALLKAMEERSLKPTRISGSSAGALVGALYAAGNDTETMLQFFRDTPLFRFNYFAARRPGLLDSYKYMETLSEYLPKTFAELNIELSVTAVNLEKGIPVHFNKGELFRPIAASCSVPLIFTPVSINKELYADGGIMNNFPVDAMPEDLFLIGSYLNNPGEMDRSNLQSSLRILNRSNLLLQHANIQTNLEKVDLLFEFHLWEYGVFDTKKIDEIYSLAYDISCRKLDAHLKELG